MECQVYRRRPGQSHYVKSTTQQAETAAVAAQQALDRYTSSYPVGTDLLVVTPRNGRRSLERIYRFRVEAPTLPPPSRIVPV